MCCFSTKLYSPVNSVVDGFKIVISFRLLTLSLQLFLHHKVLKMEQFIQVFNLNTEQSTSNVYCWREGPWGKIHGSEALSYLLTKPNTCFWPLSTMPDLLTKDLWLSLFSCHTVFTSFVLLFLLPLILLVDSVNSFYRFVYVDTRFCIAL